MTVGDRIALISDGTVRMLDTPSNVYNRPANIFTAKFIGSPSCNIMAVHAENGRIALGGQSFCPGGGLLGVLAGRREVYFGVRPEHVALHGAHVANSLHGVVKYTENHGPRISVFVAIDGIETAASGDYAHLRAGDTVYITFQPNRIHLFNKDTGDNLGYPEDPGESENDIYKYAIA
jgi:sn-glycerol 3-phosphate transport system ATP-binding protein